jgi:hypothetical protein
MTAPRHRVRPVPSASKAPWVFHIFKVLALTSTIITTYAAYAACRDGAPAWALLLTVGVLLGNIPLGGVFGYLRPTHQLRRRHRN